VGRSKTTEWGGMDVFVYSTTVSPYIQASRMPPIDGPPPHSAYNTHLEFQIFSFFFSFFFIFINVCLFERIRVLAGMPF
jgi:hypothetical protein